MGLPHYTENSSKAGILSYSSGFLTTSKLLDTKYVFIHNYGRQEERMGEKKERKEKGEDKGN